MDKDTGKCQDRQLAAGFMQGEPDLHRPTLRWLRELFANKRDALDHESHALAAQANYGEAATAQILRHDADHTVGLLDQVLELTEN